MVIPSSSQNTAVNGLTPLKPSLNAEIKKFAYFLRQHAPSQKKLAAQQTGSPTATINKIAQLIRKEIQRTR